MKFITLFLIGGLLTANSVFGQQGLSAAEIEFEFVSKGVDGTLKGFQSESSINSEDLTTSVFKGSVAVSTIRTGIFLRDWSLKGKKYFNEDAYPRIYFESTQISKKGDDYHVDGLLTLKGTQKPLSIVFSQKGSQLIGTTSLNTTDFGITVIKKNKADNLVNVRMVFDLK